MEPRLCSGRGSFMTSAGNTRVEVFNGTDRPYKPCKISIDDQTPLEVKAGFMEMARAIQKLSTEEELLEYVTSLLY